MVEFINGALYSCDCGYNTLYSKHACQHTKTKKCSGKVMKKEELRFVKEEDHLAALGNTSNIAPSIATTIDGDNNVVDNSVNINLVLPERTTKEDFIEYLSAMEYLGFRTPEQIATMPGKMLMFTRDCPGLSSKGTTR